MIFEKVKSIIVDQLDVDEEKVTMNANIQDDLGAKLFNNFIFAFGNGRANERSCTSVRFSEF